MRNPSTSQRQERRTRTSTQSSQSTSWGNTATAGSTSSDDARWDHHNAVPQEQGGSSPHSDALLLALQRSHPDTRLFRALFPYIPLSDSPNENPHLELPLRKGDYILVRGEMDEDEFYYGENVITGQSGLVPSNYIERVDDSALLKNAARTHSQSLHLDCRHRKSGGKKEPVSILKSVATQSPPSSIQRRNQQRWVLDTGPVGDGTVMLNCTDQASTSYGIRAVGEAESHRNAPISAPSAVLPSSSSHSSPRGERGDANNSPSFPVAVPSYYSSIVHDFTDTSSSNSVQMQVAERQRIGRLGEMSCGPNGALNFQPSTTSSSQQQSLPAEDACPYPPIDVSKVIVREIKRRNDQPRELTIERRLSRSVVCSWFPPEDQTLPVSQYHVCVDGAVKVAVPGSYKCKALVEELGLEGSVNLSVRAIYADSNVPSSPDAACTMAVGAEAPIAAQHLRVTNVTPQSAELSWYPSNSNAEHILMLNAMKIGVVPPGIFQVQVNGLAPSTIYRASVRTKHPKAVLEKRPVERCIDFKTLPKIGQPDPPSNAQVEFGPQPESLLVTWKPVLTQPKPPSRAAIDGYLVLGDGKIIAQVSSATADHILLRLRDFLDDPPLFITVRSRTREGAISCDSTVVRVPRPQNPAASTTSCFQPQPTTSANLVDNTSQQYLLTTAAGGAPAPTYFTTPAVVDNSVQQHRDVGLLTTASTAMIPQQQPSNYLANTAAGQQIPLAFQQPMIPTPSSGIVPQHPPVSISTLYHQPPLPQHITEQFPMTIQQQQQQPQPIMQQPLNYQQRYPTSAGTGAPVPLPSRGGQYYTFHPKALHREQPSTGEGARTSVLEMETDYLLRHRQQMAPGSGPVSFLGARAQYYASSGSGGVEGSPRCRRILPPPQALRSPQQPAVVTRPEATVMPGERHLPMPLPRHLARIRSEEQMIGGTRSEPDLRRPPPELSEMLYGGGAGATAGSNCRWFVALFDYDPVSMSPNPNAQQEELPFRKHQLIKVYGEVDEDGFYYAEINKRFGLVPSNMLIEIAQNEMVEERRRAALYTPGDVGVAQDPIIRRMKWGSIKSRSYDNPDQRRTGQRGRHHLIQHPAASARYHRHSFAEPSMSSGAEAARELPPFPMATDSPSLERRERERSLPPTATRSQQQPLMHNGRRYDRPTGGDEPPLSTRSAYEYSVNSRFGGGEADRDGTYRRENADSRVMQRRPAAEGTDYRGMGRGQSSSPHGESYPSRVREAPQPSSRYQHQNHIPPSTSQRGDREMSQPVGRSYESTYDEPHLQRTTGAGSTATAQRFPRSTQRTMFEGSYGDQQQQQQQQQHSSYNADYPTNYDAEEGKNMGYEIDPEAPARRMVAKYDYDARQFSPNVDGGQMELSFRKGDSITVFGDMDEDGFYIGELDGNRGLVPSNFLQLASVEGLSKSTPPHQTGPAPTRSQVQDATEMAISARPKGVAFSEGVEPKRSVGQVPPGNMFRQVSQQSAGKTPSLSSFGLAGPGGGISAAGARSVKSPALQVNKQLTKKTSEMGAKQSSAQNAVRKQSQPPKKAETGKKK